MRTSGTLSTFTSLVWSRRPLLHDRRRRALRFRLLHVHAALGVDGCGGPAAGRPLHAIARRADLLRVFRADMPGDSWRAGGARGLQLAGKSERSACVHVSASLQSWPTRRDEPLPGLLPPVLPPPPRPVPPLSPPCRAPGPYAPDPAAYRLSGPQKQPQGPFASRPVL